MKNGFKIDVQNLNVWFSDNHVLKDISLGLKANSVTAIMGPSGCGKTTFIRAINRLNELIKGSRTTGKIYIDDKEIFDDDFLIYELRRRVGMVFQKPNPFPKSIFGNIVFGPKVQGITNDEELTKIVENSLREAALWEEVKDRLDKSALDLSGGQQQRLCIARTIAMRPEVILMDEPCSALDPKSTIIIEDLINELKKDYTIVIVTHNMQQAARVSDYTAFFYEGELIEYGETGKIFTKPDKEQTEDYITGRFG